MKSSGGGLSAGLPAAGGIGGCAVFITLLETFLPSAVSRDSQAIAPYQK
jgi:hypothetical protein